MKSRSPQLPRCAGRAAETCGNVAPWSKDAAITGYIFVCGWKNAPLACMKET